MKTIAITGGIASGKSTVVKILQKLGKEKIKIFDCDKIAKEIRNALMPQYRNDVKKLREIITKDKQKRQQLEALVHPLISKQFKEEKQKENANILILDAPLYYETKETFEVDAVCAVVCKQETQIKRALQRNKEITEEEIKALINAQLPTEEKIKRADIVIYNEEDETSLEKQVVSLYKKLMEE